MGETTQEKKKASLTEVRDNKLEKENFQFRREKLNHQVSQNNLGEEETSKEEDLFREAEEEAGIMRLDVIPMEIQDICLGIVEEEDLEQAIDLTVKDAHSGIGLDAAN